MTPSRAGSFIETVLEIAESEAVFHRCFPKKTMSFSLGPGPAPPWELCSGASYWIPAVLSEEIPVADCPPVRVRLLSEELVAFRDNQGRVGLLDEHCSDRGTSNRFRHLVTTSEKLPTTVLPEQRLAQQLTHSLKFMGPGNSAQ